MNTEFNNIGENAGIVWRALNNQKCSWEELLKTTGLHPLELSCAIGWLARENKVSFSLQTGIVYFELFRETYY